MASKKPIKLSKRESENFKDGVLHVLRRFGFQKNEEGQYDYVLMTDKGTLNVSVRHQTLACNFQEAENSGRTMIDREHSSFSSKWDPLGPDILPLFCHDLTRLVGKPTPNPDLAAAW